MNKNKFFLGLILILLVVFVAELFILQKINLFNWQAKTVTKPVLRLDPKVYGKKPLDTTKSIHPEFMTMMGKFVTTEDYVDDYKMYLQIEKKGTLAELDLDGQDIGGFVSPFGFRFEDVKKVNPSADLWTYLSEDLYSKTSFSMMKNGQKQSAKVTDLAVGQKILFIEKSDLRYSPRDNRHTVSGEIIILE